MSSFNSFATKVVHTVRNPKKQHGCVNNGIFQSSTIVFDKYEDFIYADSIYNGSVKMNPRQKTYGRNGTETIFDCQEAIANLYGAYYSKMASSGYAAILIAMNAFCSAGSHILASDGVYGPTRNLIVSTLKRYGVEHTFFKPDVLPEEVEQLIKPNTTIIYLESPSSLTFEVQDISGIAQIAKKYNVRTILDNTFFTAYYCDPFKYGVDVVVEACTKYLNGHSDILAGVVVFNEKYSAAIAQSTREIGANLSPISAYQIMRGIRTLKVRLDAHKKSVDEVISEIKQHPRIIQILHPSQETTPGNNFYKEQTTGYTSLFSIVLDAEYSKAKLSKFFNRMQLFAIGYSWGGYESLAIPFPENLQSHRSFPLISDKNTGIRIYIGFEDTQDLIQDLKASLDVL